HRGARLHLHLPHHAPARRARRSALGARRGDAKERRTVRTRGTRRRAAILARAEPPQNRARSREVSTQPRREANGRATHPSNKREPKRARPPASWRAAPRRRWEGSRPPVAGRGAERRPIYQIPFGECGLVENRHWGAAMQTSKVHPVRAVVPAATASKSTKASAKN